MLNLQKFVNLFKIENLIEREIDEIDFGTKDHFSKVVIVRKEMADDLINDNEVVNQGIIFVNELIRGKVELAIDCLKSLPCGIVADASYPISNIFYPFPSIQDKKD